eukprot:CAMPEP_0201177128 /NCGR_PEP_ID=MMETSP0851-20130426/106649_1 /ASSEMBLY_ACC=CAM_ASM_000631 /TAXON_ID=183588 /ORGANISM="Pseudo-nitzschia fraudulenta, Strain WWA7" /LENGTH=814 /DNA_ID=CAMNT_0047460667 /DNA_START=71 /DNA_END=2512 /DNA_ORIENTATION=-
MALLLLLCGSTTARGFRGVSVVPASSFRRRSSRSSSARAAFSSSSVSGDNNNDKADSAHRRIAMTLYRQLLRWCDDTDQKIPLSQCFPPIHLSPPQINPESLKEQEEAMERKTRDVVDIIINTTTNNDNDNDNKNLLASLFPSQTTVAKKTGITVHSVRDSFDAKQIVQAVFRMNARTTNEQHKKDHLSTAFEWIKALNELTNQVEEMKTSRREHQNREGVRFRIGQVVKHKTVAWRGVILGWNRTDASGGERSPPATSLTQKPYESMRDDDDDDNGNDEDAIEYDVAVDWGDASLLHSARHPSGFKNVYQCDLTLVDDPDLMRIRSTTDQFQRFDPELRSFVPGDTLSYTYPCDKPTDEGDDPSRWTPYQNQSDESAENITLGIQSFAEHLRRIILGYTSAPESRNLPLLSEYLEKLTKLSEGDAVPTEEKFRGGRSGRNESATTQTTMKWQLQKLIEITVEIGDILWTRQKALETDRSIKFSLGEYVQHKKYGFRGVVVGWDPEPAYEVTHWDGLQHIENPEQYPFYHVIPDRNDVMVAFGAERRWRYVCEENLEPCAQENRDLDIDLEPEWTKDDKKGMYKPPDELLLRHGYTLEDDGVTELCLEEIKNAFNIVFFAMRNGPNQSAENGDSEVRAILERLSLENLFHVLKHAEDFDTATVLSDAFKEAWKGHNNKEIRFKFDTGVNYLLTGNTDKALSMFCEVVDDDPTYAEAWNKASTCEFMIGNLDASMAAAHKTLEIMPDHFQALNGLGLVYNEKRDLLHARDNFRKSIELDPWSPVAPRLSVCLDTLQRWKKTSLLSVEENDDGPEW